MWSKGYSLKKQAVNFEREGKDLKLKEITSENFSKLGEIWISEFMKLIGHQITQDIFSKTYYNKTVKKQRLLET